jgi:hypothetical protein
MAFPRKKHPKCNHEWIQALDQWHLMYGQICYARIKPYNDRYSMSAMAYNAKFYINDGNYFDDLNDAKNAANEFLKEQTAIFVASLDLL